MKLSVVVPIYNVENYLHRCVDSLLNQDLKPSDYEIILIDDGSTDGSGAIADAYAAKFSHIRTIHQANAGLSGARNTGISAAYGEYLQFVDSDDYLEPNVLNALLDKMAAERLDVLRFNYQNVDERYHVFEPYKEHKPFVDYRDSVTDGLTFLTERLGYGCYAWQFMMRADLVKGCRFTEGIYFEDTDWTPRLLASAQRVTSVDTLVYNYLMRRGSITQSISCEKKRKLLDDKLFLLDSLSAQMADKVDKRWYRGMVAATVVSLLGMVATDFWKSRSAYLTQLKQKRLYPLSLFHASPRTRCKIQLINLSPILFCWLVGKVKN